MSGGRRMRFVMMIGGMSLLLSACDTVSYLSQAASGQWHILRARQPIPDLLNAADTNAELKRKLDLIQTARQWAADELHLKIGGSYTDYVALDRPYVVWNVFAAPEFSVKPMQWCFPIAGCVSYRGYFSEEDARAYATHLQSQGVETYVGGVEAYSTLGWFDDPVLSTFVRRSDASLAGLIFHELAHRTLYVKNDSTFNESFATVVEEEGLRRWLEQRQQATEWDRYVQQERYQQDFIALVLEHRRALETLYAENLANNQKRTEKQKLTAALRKRYQTLRDTQWQGYNGYDRWMNDTLNNAQLSTIATYHDYVPAFRTLLQRCENALPCFYSEVRTLAELDPDARKRTLALLHTP